MGIWLLKLWLASWFWLASVMVSFAHNGLGAYLRVDSYCVSCVAGHMVTHGAEERMAVELMWPWTCLISCEVIIGGGCAVPSLDHDSSRAW